MAKERDKGSLSAYERWELPAMGEVSEVGGQRDAAVALTPRRRKTDFAPQPADEPPARPPTAAELQQIRDAAREEGYREGHEQGLAAGRKSGHAEGYQTGLREGREEGARVGREQAFVEQKEQIAAHLRDLAGVLASLADPVAAEAQQVREVLLHMLVQLVETVLGREVLLSSEHLGRLVDEALACLPEQPEGLQVRLHPIDEAFLRSQSFSCDQPVRLVADASVARGGCRVEGRRSRVEWQLSERFEQVIETWLQSLDVPLPRPRDKAGDDAE